MTGKPSHWQRLRPAFAMEGEVSQQHAQWRDPASGATWGASPGEPLDGADAAVSALTANGCRKTLGKELAASGIKDYVPLGREGQEVEPVAREGIPPSGPL